MYIKLLIFNFGHDDVIIETLDVPKNVDQDTSFY